MRGKRCSREKEVVAEKKYFLVFGSGRDGIRMGTMTGTGRWGKKNILLELCPSLEKAVCFYLVPRWFGWPTTISSPIMEPRKKECRCPENLQHKKKDFFPPFNSKQRDPESGLKM